MNVRIESSWQQRLQSEFDKPYFENLTAFVRHEYATKTVYPPGSQIFAAFDACPFDQVKVVILGQDPYHEPRQAHGLCFSVNDHIPVPRSGNLTRWAQQGVLLLNATLTVEAHRAASHQGRGWETFTDAVIHKLAEEREHLVFILWGSYAQRKGDFIDRSRHLVLQSPHPSPLSAHRGFFGNHHFSQTNQYLEAHGIEPIRW